MRRGALLGATVVLAVAVPAVAGEVRLVPERLSVPRGTEAAVGIRNDTFNGLATGVDYRLYDLDRRAWVDVLGPDGAWTLQQLNVPAYGTFTFGVDTSGLAPGRYRVEKDLTRLGRERTVSATFAVTP